MSFFKGWQLGLDVTEDSRGRGLEAQAFIHIHFSFPLNTICWCVCGPSADDGTFPGMEAGEPSHVKMEYEVLYLSSECSEWKPQS